MSMKNYLYLERRYDYLYADPYATKPAIRVDERDTSGMQFLRDPNKQPTRWERVLFADDAREVAEMAKVIGCTLAFLLLTVLGIIIGRAL